MGLEWINKASKTFTRSCQRGYASITSAKLFDATVADIERSFKAKLVDGQAVETGTQVFVRADDTTVRLYSTEERVIGEIEQSPSWLLDKLKAVPQGLAVGVIDS